MENAQSARLQIEIVLSGIICKIAIEYFYYDSIGDD